MTCAEFEGRLCDCYRSVVMECYRECYGVDGGKKRFAVELGELCEEAGVQESSGIEGRLLGIGYEGLDQLRRYVCGIGEDWDDRMLEEMKEMIDGHYEDKMSGEWYDWCRMMLSLKNRVYDMDVVELY